MKCRPDIKETLKETAARHKIHEKRTHRITSNYYSRQLLDSIHSGLRRIRFGRLGVFGMLAAGTNGSANGFSFEAPGLL